MNKKILSIYVDAELKKQLVQEAEERHLTLNAYIRILLYDRDKIINANKK